MERWLLLLLLLLLPLLLLGRSWVLLCPLIRVMPPQPRLGC